MVLMKRQSTHVVAGRICCVQLYFSGFSCRILHVLFLAEKILRRNCILLLAVFTQVSGIYQRKVPGLADFACS